MTRIPRHAVALAACLTASLPSLAAAPLPAIASEARSPAAIFEPITAYGEWIVVAPRARREEQP